MVDWSVQDPLELNRILCNARDEIKVLRKSVEAASGTVAAILNSLPGKTITVDLLDIKRLNISEIESDVSECGKVTITLKGK